MNNGLDDFPTRVGSTNGIVQDGNNQMGYSSEPRREISRQHQVEGSDGTFNTLRRAIAAVLSQFYLIRTPYVFIVGRKSPNVSTQYLSSNVAQIST